MRDRDNHPRRQRDADRRESNNTPLRRRGDTHGPNPPRTTKDGITAPKFGSAGSGGAEIEPGIEKD